MVAIHLEQALVHPAQPVVEDHALGHHFRVVLEPGVEEALHTTPALEPGHQLGGPFIECHRAIRRIRDHQRLGRLPEQKLDEGIALALHLVAGRRRHRLLDHRPARDFGIEQRPGQAGLFRQVTHVARTDDDPEFAAIGAQEQLPGLFGGAVGLVHHLQTTEIGKELGPGGLMLVGQQQDPATDVRGAQHGIDHIRLAHLQHHHRLGQGVLEVVGVGARAHEDVHSIRLHHAPGGAQGIVEDAVDDGDVRHVPELRDQRMHHLVELGTADQTDLDPP